jgi:hypothetical protein
MKNDLTDAEEIAIDTLWRPKGFVDVRTSAFIKNSRYFQWRINVALVIAIGFIALCFAKPEWLISHSSVPQADLNWVTTYVALRGVMGLGILLTGIYCWVRNVSMKTFWRVFTLLAVVMLAVDLNIVPSATNAQSDRLPYVAFIAFRLALIGIGLLNVWHNIYAPGKRSRSLLFWKSPSSVTK